MSAHAGVFASPVDELQHPELAIWRANVGAPVALDLAPAREAPVAGIDLLSWNVAVGAGRLTALLERLADGAWGGAGRDPGRPLLVLVQEAFRSDPSVPDWPESGRHGGALHPAEPEDIADVARAFSLSLRYAPSMRNGLHASDRGNAILSAAPLGTSHAFLLPYVRQRRVVVTAELAALPAIAFASAHLDVSGQAGGRTLGRFGGGRVLQARALAARLLGDDARPIVLGGDLNTPLGLRDPALLTLIRAGLHPAQRDGNWRGTLRRGPLRLLLDHVLFRPGGQIRSVRVQRLDESPRRPRVFGSDHHPLLARIELGEPD